MLAKSLPALLIFIAEHAHDQGRIFMSAKKDTCILCADSTQDVVSSQYHGTLTDRIRIALPF